MNVLGRVASWLARGPAPQVVMGVVAMYPAAWLLSFAAGGASVLAPHAFYLPVVVVGLRFGVFGAAGAGVLAALVAGPLLPADVSAGEAQLATDWIGRGIFFVLVGVVTRLTRAMTGEERAQLRREAELHAAIASNQLLVLYQPLVRLDTGAVVGAEALVRWLHPTRGMLGPQEFIPFAEQRGLVDEVGGWVLDRAVADMRDWHTEFGPISIRELAVNLSRRQFSEESKLIAHLDDLIEAGPLPLELIMEVTETALASSQALMVDQLMALQMRGVRVAVDDFGTGQSTVVAVRDLPVDIIKIDKTFIDGLTSESTDREIVKNTVDLAERLGKRTIAEGVETIDQAEALLALGVRHAQGYLFAPPMPIHDLRQWTKERPSLTVIAEAHRRILVVDDRRTDRTYLEYLLQDHGDVHLAASGEEAIEAVSADEFTVVLMDIHMPGMSGLETVRAIRDLERRHKRHRQLIVGLSARDLPDDEQAARAAGMDGYLTKPLDVNQLNRTLADFDSPIAEDPR